jgi:hypothetical protein
VEFRKAGVEIFLTQMSPQLEEMERFAAEVMPLVDSELGDKPKLETLEALAS